MPDYYALYKERKEPRYRSGSIVAIREVIIGGGPHAAIYANNRIRRCLLFDPTPGGLFSVPGGSAWTLNSRNKPGEPDTPGGKGALNALPGCPVQAADLAGGQYQTNDPLAWAVKFSLVDRTRVARGRVEQIVKTAPGLYSVSPNSGPKKRIIIATGLGEQRRGLGVGFLDFMLDYVKYEFPLQGLRRIAVIGAGDSGNTVVEALLGEGPKDTGPLSKGYVERIDWFGQQIGTRERWCEAKRPRYHRVGIAFPSAEDVRESRIKPYFRKADLVEKKMVLSFGQWFGPYDMIINCTGFINTSESLLPDGMIATEFRDPETNEPLGRKVLGEEIYMVGPCADLPFTRKEYNDCKVTLDLNGENKVALWRYGPKTARLARLLP